MENSEAENESHSDSDPGSYSEGANAGASAANASCTGVPVSDPMLQAMVEPMPGQVGPQESNEKVDRNESSSVSDPGPPSEVDALHAHNFLVEETLLSALAYQPRPSDVFTVSYPKCGSTLLQFLVFGIYTRGQPSTEFLDFALRSPYLEWLGTWAVLNMRRPGAIKTHLPFDKHPYNPQAKYIYIVRNPFDCCAAYYTHMRNMPLTRPEVSSFDAFFDAFLEGKVIYGDYFDHVFSWYDRRHDANVLFITYEDLKSDPGAWTVRIAEFIDQPFAQELRDDPVLLSDVLNMASLNGMSATCDQGVRSILADELATVGGREPITTAEFYKGIFAEALEIAEGSDFTRRPIWGLWKDFFKPEQVRRMKEWMTQKTSGTDLLSIWSNIELP
ncbi:hypothetical protein V5799_031720 [Amblyomma americanum]|uniref:Sulfotransferase domain-containing protein n=1 Tax=Amblyomma americanum TaxID=6943 RepID=A0AAQ4DT81_AMBAM